MLCLPTQTVQPADCQPWAKLTCTTLERAALRLTVWRNTLAEILLAWRQGLRLEFCVQGSFRHTLLDLLQCMGVEVQKNMDPARVTHVIALDVDDRKSAKLEAARQ